MASIVGSIYGGIAAYFGGVVDDVMMRIVEILLSVPYLLIVILISVVTDSKSLGTMLVALTLTGWCGIARIVRGQMLQLKSQEFVLAANALGVSPMKTILKHMIPNTMSLIIVAITFDIPGYIFSEAFLSYVGLGIQAPQTSWGALSTAAQQNFMFYPYQLLFPAIMIALTMLSFTLLGTGFVTRWIRSRENNRGNEDGKQREYPGGGKPSSIISYLCRGSQSSPRRQLFIEPRRDSGVRRRVRMREIGHSQTDYAAVKAAGSRDCRNPKSSVTKKTS